MKNNPPEFAGLPIRVTGLPWFRREDFANIKAIMEDGQRLHKTWEEWHFAAQKTEQTLKSQGHTTVRVLLLPDEFTAFCKARGEALNAQSRMNFAAYTAHQAHKQTH